MPHRKQNMFSNLQKINLVNRRYFKIEWTQFRDNDRLEQIKPTACFAWVWLHAKKCSYFDNLNFLYFTMFYLKTTFLFMNSKLNPYYNCGKFFFIFLLDYAVAFNFMKFKSKIIFSFFSRFRVVILKEKIFFFSYTLKRYYITAILK
jgi:hypothetical protein